MNKKILILSGVTLLGLTICIGLNSKLSNKESESYNNMYENKTEKSSKDIYMNISGDMDSIFDNSNLEELEGRSELIIIGKVKSIDGAINYNEKAKEYILTSTIGKIEVDNVIKGNDIVSINDEIPFIRLGGTISVAEYEKSLTERQIIRQGIDKLSTEEKKNKYIKFAFSGDIDIEENKTYLMYMLYDNDFERYDIIGMEYGLKEYDMKLNRVKNNVSNSWENIHYEVK